MMNAVLPALFALFLSVFCSPVFGQAPVDVDRDDLIETTLSSVSRVERISSDFIQERRLAMLKKGTVVRGHFYYEKPDRLRWEQKEPVRGGFIVNGSDLRRWGEDGRVESANLAREPAFGLFVSQVFAWCKGDADWLKKRYEIRVVGRSPATIRLIPTTKAEKRYLEHLTITFSDDRSYVRIVDIQTRDKDVISTTFVNTSIDQPLAKELFEK
jgi:outer membrane lipoprotein-sorting protein